MAKKTNSNDESKPAVLKIKITSVKSLTNDPKNARNHSERNLAVIQNSLEKYGQRKPIVIRGKVVIAGNATLEAARRMGWEKIATVSADNLSEYEAQEFAIVDNRSSDLSEFDDDRLLDILGDMDPQTIHLIGFDESEIESLRGSPEPPEPPPPPQNGGGGSSQVVITIQCFGEAYSRIQDVLKGWECFDDISMMIDDSGNE